jgi:hypothetical protein
MIQIFSNKKTPIEVENLQKELLFNTNNLLDSSNYNIHCQAVIWSASSVMMRIQAVTRSQHSKLKED